MAKIVVRATCRRVCALSSIGVSVSRRNLASYGYNYVFLLIGLEKSVPFMVHPPYIFMLSFVFNEKNKFAIIPLRRVIIDICIFLHTYIH